jgi:subtilisin family serine protease
MNTTDRRGTRLSASLVVALMLAFAQQAHTDGQQPDRMRLGNDRLPDEWFVELASPPSADGTAESSIDLEQRDFHGRASTAGIRYTVRRSYHTLWNGVAVHAASAEIARLRDVLGVRAVYPVHRISADAFKSPVGLDLTHSVPMIGGDIVQNTLGITGRGVTVAVIDSGIDYQHPDLGGCFGPHCRVSKGWDFVGDAFDANADDPVIAPDPDPLDTCNGHGTHVAGIVGANGAIKGVAPDVTFHIYRVFGCTGTTRDDIVMEALERAFRDHADVVNMSLGNAFGWPEDPLGQAADRLVRKGVVVAASIGNGGPILYAAGSPGLGNRAIGVGSVDNAAITQTAFSIDPAGEQIGYTTAVGSPAAPSSGTWPMARTGTSSSPADACGPLLPGSLTGRAALVRRGGCTFRDKAINAQAAGAASVIFYNDVAGFISPTVEGTPALTIPAVAISAEQGGLIDSRLAAGPVALTWTTDVTTEPSPTAGLVSDFSSYGPSANLTVKPDLSAPGGAIRSTFPLALGGYATLSGTSMSTPHVAGAAALYLQARSRYGVRPRPDEVLDALVNTAVPVEFGAVGSGLIDSIHAQGSGLLRIDSAILATTRVTPSKLALGEFPLGRQTTKVVRLVLKNHSNRKLTYTLGHVPALATGLDRWTVTRFAASASVLFSPASVTLRRYEERAIFVAVSGLTDANARLFGGYITVTPSDGSPALHVPYLGYNGNYQEIQILTPAGIGLPWLASFDGEFLTNLPFGGAFTMIGNDVPFFVVHFDHQVRTVHFEAVDAVTGESHGLFVDEHFDPSNSTPTEFFAVAWDGTTTTWKGQHPQPVPNGAYRVVVRVLKPLGNPANPADTETFVSPTVVIARP